MLLTLGPITHIGHANEKPGILSEWMSVSAAIASMRPGGFDDPER
jgi:hypothetical protein